MTSVISTVIVEGFHQWSGHKHGSGFLAKRHRHLFKVYLELRVNHDDRDIEFIEAGQLVRKQLAEKYGTPCEFGEMSCEMIAKFVIQQNENVVSCEVWEDDENGARVIV